MTALLNTERTGSASVGWRIVVIAAAVALGLRLWNLGSAPFVFDEPIFLTAARDQLRTGDWISSSPIAATQGLRYGPTVFWFYSVVQWVFGDDPRIAIVAMCVLLTTSQVLLARAVTRLFGGGATAFLLLFGFVLSSPYLHFWSRLAWDQTVLVCVAAAVAVLCGPSDLRVRHAVGTGFLVGLAVSSHLMVLPFVFVLVAVVAWELRSCPARLARIVGSLVATAVVVNLPYLWYVVTHSPSPSEASPDLSGLAANLAETPAVSTAHGFEYFLDASWPDFRDWSGAAEPLLHLRGPLLVALVLVAIRGLFAASVGDDIRRRRIALLALGTWGGSAVAFALQGVGQEPHYQFATWWVMPVGLAGALRLAQPRPALARPVALAAILVTTFQATFLATWVGYVEERVGTRGVHHGSPVDEQIAAVQEICASSATSVDVVNETSVFAESLGYLVLTTRDCSGKEIYFCAPGSCRDSTSGSGRMGLSYRDDKGGALVVTDLAG